MARFTLLELHLDGAQFTANAPFSGEESPEGIGKSIEERVGSKSKSESAGRRSSSSLPGILLGIVALVGLAAVVRRLLSRDGASLDEATAEEPIIAD